MCIQDIRILLVEDNEIDACLIHRMFSRNQQMCVRIERAESLHAAIEMAGTNVFDIILLDLGLPDSQGLQAVKLLHERSHSIPIVVLTGDDHHETGFAAIEAGAQDFLCKQDLEEQLLTRLTIHAILRQKQLIEVRKHALRDSLTGIGNRRSCDLEFENHLKSLQEQGTPFCVAIFDIDHFKIVNDLGGHDLGDVAIGRVGRALQQVCRPQDCASRFGGEEFSVLFANMTLAQLPDLLENHRRAVEALVFPELPRGITVSVGATNVHPNDDCRSAYRRADEALYNAKQRGRNRCELQPTRPSAVAGDQVA